VADSAQGTFEDPISWATIESGDARYGYLWVASFADIVEGSVDDNLAMLHETVENALTDWGEIDGVIIDVRINQGGWDVLGRALASHFVGEETHVYSKRVRFAGTWTEEVSISVSPHDGARYTGPVALLSSNTTISAAETFVLALRALDQVTVVGEPTYGILSDSLPKFLPSGIYFSLSNEEYSTPSGDVYELTGVPPHVEVEVFSQSDREAGRDGSIEAAILALGGE
jgi:C-terminal processing protease CtpA/Prc